MPVSQNEGRPKNGDETEPPIKPHTPAPLTHRDNYCYANANFDVVARASVCIEQDAEANARRIAATWNPCEGLDTAVLERAEVGALAELVRQAKCALLDLTEYLADNWDGNREGWQCTADNLAAVLAPFTEEVATEKASATYVCEVDAGNDGESVVVYRTEGGALFGIDASFVENFEPVAVREPIDGRMVRLIGD